MNEAENTFRVLAEKPLLVKSWLCYFGWHRWTLYGQPKQRKEGVYSVDYQTRHCANCNLLNLKILRRV